MKRSDGTMIGRDPAAVLQEARERVARAFQREIRRCALSTLVPYEASVVESVVASRLAELQQGASFQRQPRGVEVDGVILIEDGANRVVACVRHGAREIDVEIVQVDPRNLAMYRKTIAHRQAAGTTFENLPVDASDDERAARTVEELRELNG